jgi:hydroxymethylpyrimidine kinase / phosphomethylpyrimidine kinase / thiamine-phosphate diphosphorylase
MAELNSKQNPKPTVWSIAGSDNSGGAGIQADNLTFHDFAVHGCNIVTAVTAQNSTGVYSVTCVDVAVFNQQWQTLEQDYAPAAIKLGMLGNETLVNALVDKLSASKAQVICDPVLRATSGGQLIDKVDAYQRLLPLVDVLTPNQQEFSALFNVTSTTHEQLETHARAIAKKFDLQLVITGGDSLFDNDYASDLCVIDGQAFWMHSLKIDTSNTHGTGCTLSSAITAALAKGYSLLEACVLAKVYINQGLSSPNYFNAQKGPVQHCGFPATLDCLPSISAQYNPQVLEFPRMDTLQLGVYPVVDSLAWLQRCLQAGVKTIQLRVKNVEPDVLDAMIAEAVAMGKQFSARLFINDYWQLAIKHKAYGAHLGQEDIDIADLKAIEQAGLYLGISTHSWYEIARAHSLKPSYIAIGPIYSTTTKVMPFAPQGLEQLKQWVDLIGNVYPVVAIGGIDLQRAKAVVATGVGSVAMVRAVTEADNYQQALCEFAAIMEL